MKMQWQSWAPTLTTFFTMVGSINFQNNVANNSLFFLGNWTIWSDMTLDMKKMKIMQFDKKTVLTHLGLKSEEKQLFVALAGGLYSSIENVKEIGKYFCQYQNNIDKFKMIVKFVQTYESPPNEKTLGNIVKKIFKQNIPQLVEDFRETLASFESNHYFVDSEKTNIMEKFKDEYLCYGQEILRDCKLYISSVYLDLNVDKGLLKKLVLPWIEKTVEALLKNEDDPKTISLMMKDFDQVQISEHEIKVGISECNFYNILKHLKSF